MNIQDWFIKWNGKFCPTGSVPNQCVNIVKEYMISFLGLPEFKGDAIAYWKDIPGFTRIPKTLFNRPLTGDIIVWNFNHIGICNWTTFFTLNCFEQNNPVNSPCHFQTHSSYKNILGWLRPLSVSLPRNPLTIARLGLDLPLGEAFLGQVSKYSNSKIICNLNDYSNYFSGTLSQDMAYQIVDKVNPKEKFIFIFYEGAPDSVFYATYFYPKRDCMITSCPGIDARLLSFEFSHQLQTYFNNHRGNNPPVEIVDSMFPSDDLITTKYDSVSRYYA